MTTGRINQVCALPTDAMPKDYPQKIHSRGTLEPKFSQRNLWVSMSIRQNNKIHQTIKGNFDRTSTGGAKKWHPTASKCCLQQTMEGGLRASQKGTQSPNSTLLHWPKPCEQVVNSTQRVQDSPFVNKRTRAHRTLASEP